MDGKIVIPLFYDSFLWKIVVLLYVVKVASNNGQFIFRQFQRILIDSDDEGYFTSNSDSFVQKIGIVM